MKGDPIEFQSVLATEIADFLRHQRSLGKRFINEERGLLLFDRYLFSQNLGSAEYHRGHRGRFFNLASSKSPP